MKLTATLGLILLCWHACTTETHGYALKVDPLTKLKDCVNSDIVRDTIKKGSPSLGFPPLDPCKLDHIPINVTEKEVQMKGNMTNIKVEGLAAFIVNNAEWKSNFKSDKIIIDLTFPKVTASCGHALSGKVTDMEIEGNGDMKFVVINFDIKVEADIEWVGEYTQLKLTEVQSKLALEALECSISGIKANGEDISDILNIIIPSIVPSLIAENQDTITSFVNPAIKEIANSLLSKTEMQPIIDKCR